MAKNQPPWRYLGAVVWTFEAEGLPVGGQRVMFGDGHHVDCGTPDEARALKRRLDEAIRQELTAWHEEREADAEAGRIELRAESDAARRETEGSA